MKLITYIKYFYFLYTNWDFNIAWQIIKQEIKGEREYKINTCGADELINLEELGIDISHAAIYMPVSYSLLKEIFKQLPLTERNHFLDIGCGMGRALCIAAHQGYKKISGLDLSKNLCDIAKQNLTKTQEQIASFQFTIINNDAFYYKIPPNVDCIFLFNPFDEIIMSGVINNIFESLQNNPRKIKIIYANPLYKDQFLKAGYSQIWQSKKMEYIEAVILEN